MASTADLVVKNFRWRIESIDPSHGKPRRGFRWVDPERLGPEDTANPRQFNVRWLGEDEGEGVTDMTERVSAHQFAIEVYYPHEYPLGLRQEIMLQDRHDIMKALRDDRNFTGYSAANSTTDIGLWSRRILRAELAEDYEGTTTLRMEVECHVKEEE